MKNTEYTFAVARIRSNESRLLSSRDYDAVISAADCDDAVRRLADKGYRLETGSDYSAALEDKAAEYRELVMSLLKDRSQLDSMIIKNDFANLKVIEKARILGKSADGLFTLPGVWSPYDIQKAVFAGDNGALPEPLRHSDRSARRILEKTRFAQLADTVIDRAAMEWSVRLAKKSGCALLVDVAEARTALADIKVLYRCILTGKEESFMNRAAAECSYFDKREIIRAALSGEEGFLKFLSGTALSGAAAALKVSGADFERWSDNKITDILRAAKNEYFSITPLAAFYCAAETEIKNVRIILSAKAGGLSEEVIRARVRESYV